MQFSSQLIENAVQEFSKLPGIGKKTALRLVLHLLKKNTEEVQVFCNTIDKMRSEIQFCTTCYNVSDAPVCSICANPLRKKHQICVVENIRDVIAIENTQQYNGVYHILDGLIAPLDGIGPDQIHIAPLIERVKKTNIEEIVFALSPTIQGDTTIFYIQKKLKQQQLNCVVTSIARGIAFGGEIEYADEMTLARSIQNRLPVQQYVNG